MLASLAHRDATLEQESANLVNHCGAAYDPPFADSVQRLQVELVIAFDRHKAHRGTGHRFGNRFGIDVVVLVRLHVRLHILGRHQAHVMPLFSQSAAEKMRSSAGLHADQACAKVRCKAQQLRPRALLANYDCTPCVQTYKVKDRLPKIDTNGANLHGTPPVLTSTPSKGLGGGPCQ